MLVRWLFQRDVCSYSRAPKNDAAGFGVSDIKANSVRLSSFLRCARNNSRFDRRTTGDQKLDSLQNFLLLRRLLALKY